MFCRKKYPSYPIFFLNIIWIGVLVYALLPQELTADQGRLDVVVSIAPQKYFVQKIGAEHVNISVLLPPGASPHSFEPKSSQMVKLGQSQLYMAIGVEFEQTLLSRLKSMHPELKIVHTDHGIHKITMTAHLHAHEHEDQDHDQHQSHGQDNHAHYQTDQDHAGLDPHIWLSPDLVMIQACNIYQALVQALPEAKPVFQENLIQFLQEILYLDQEIKSILDRVQPGSKFMVFHPSWGYFARNYGLIQLAVEVEGKEPKAKDLKELIHLARQEHINVVFVSPQFSAKSAQTIAEAINAETVSVDPLARDWKKNMLQVADKFRLSGAAGL